MPVKSCVPALLKIAFVLGFGGIFSLIEKSSNQWDFFVYTQVWPETACIQINETHGSGKCAIPDNVDDWTIHGLWPSVRSGKEPGYCNDSWPFRPDQVKDLESDLEIHWPNLISDESVYSLWKHEWVKHGTCATNLPAISSEHDYFKTGLDLQNRFQLSKWLKTSDIVPSKTKLYEFEKIKDLIVSHLHASVNLMCMEGKSKEEQLLAEVEICLDKSFKVIDCVDSRHRPGRRHRYSGKPLSRNPEWDWYPFFPRFTECNKYIPVRYPTLS